MPRDCIALARSLTVVPNIKMQLSGFKSKILKDISVNLCDLTGIADLINSAITETPPAQMKDGGYIKDGFNEQLDEFRLMRKNGGNLIIA